MKKILIVSPYLKTLGGGEKHIFSIAQVFDSRGYAVEVICDDKNYPQKVARDLGLQLKNLHTIGNFLQSKCILRKLLKTRSYDYLFYVTDGSYFASLAKNNYVFAMVPEKNLYRRSLSNRLKLFNFKFICNSQFTQKWLLRWKIQSKVVYPYIDERLFTADNLGNRENIVLCVGRFFAHLHSKRQEKVIEAFVQLKRREPKFANFKLILAGRLMVQDREYFRKVVFAAGKREDIKIFKNISTEELSKLYFKARYLWHFAGLGKKQEDNPEAVEHLGIAPVEAMAAGCIPFCYGAGGITESVEDGKNGFIFNDINDLFAKTVRLLDNFQLEKKIYLSARKTAREKFSYSSFSKNVVSVFKI